MTSNNKRLVLIKCKVCERWSMEKDINLGCWRHNPLNLIRWIFGVNVVHQEEKYIIK